MVKNTGAPDPVTQRWDTVSWKETPLLVEGVHGDDVNKL